MKTKLQTLLFVIFSLLNFTTNAQDTELWGMTSQGGDYNSGTIFKTDGNGENINVEESFFKYEGRSPSYGNLTQASDGKLYGMTFEGGINNMGVIFSYNSFTNIYVKHLDFNGVVNGGGPNASLIEVSNGKLYGMTASGGVNGYGVLFSYDPITNIYVKHLDFDGTNNGRNPFGSLIEATDGKLYGMTRQGGTNNLGVLFSYDMVTNIYVKHLDFNGTVNGSNPYGSLIEASNGKLHGMTYSGGTYSRGVLFSYDLVTNTYVKHLDFNGTVNGSNPLGSLTEAADGKLYGMTRQGGLYNLGVLFSYDLVTNTYVKQLDFNGINNGRYPLGSLTEAANGKLYGMTQQGGSNNVGVLFSYNSATNIYLKHLDFEEATNGKHPAGSLTEASDGRLYGMTSQGGINNNRGVLFSYNPATNEYSKHLDFNGSGNPSGSLTEVSNGKLYGMTTSGSGSGSLFSYDPVTNVYVNHLNFNGTDGSTPYGSLVEANNGKLYGMTRSGGVNSSGVLFSFDLATNTYVKHLDFNGTVNGSSPYGSLIEASNGKLYGMTYGGGIYGYYGVLFSFDPITNIYTKHFDFDDTNSGKFPQGSLVEINNGKLYGMTASGGVNGYGVLFSFDLVTNTYVKHLDFDGANNGRAPVGSLLKTYNNNLYGMTNNGGTNNKGILFEYNPVTNVFTKKLDFNGANGSNPQYGALIEVKKAVIWTTANEWSNIVGPTIDDVTIIEGDLAVGTDFGDFSAKSLTIRAGGSLVIESGHVVTVNAHITNLATEADFVVESGANLVQLKDFQNEGTATVKRESTPIVRLDYTAWGAPVEGQNLLDFSPQTLPNRFYTYDFTGTTTATAWIPVADPSTANFEPSHGYLLRAPNNWSSSVYTPYQGEFIGKPNNGSFQNTVGVGYNLLGNPYPSPLSADAFLTANAALGASSLHYWTHAVPQNGAYVPQTNYASYNLSGGTAAVAGGAQPDEFIQVGQGFLVNIATAGQAQFTNAQRSDNSNNQFFKTTTTDVDRFWLGLRTDNASFNQMLVAYINGATNEIDLGYDAKLLTNGNSYLSSLINNENYVIQGRNSVFEVNDEVPLSFTAEQSGMFTISLDAVEGIFDSQDILLWDKQLNVYHNLQTNDYSFTTNAGTFNNRFSVVYDSALNNQTFDSENNILIYKSNESLVISSNNIIIKNVKVYDIQGRLLVEKNDVNASSITVSEIKAKNQVLLVDIQTDNGSVTKKIGF